MTELDPFVANGSAMSLVKQGEWLQSSRATSYGSQIHNPPRQRPIANEPVRGLSRRGRARLCTKRIEEV